MIFKTEDFNAIWGAFVALMFVLCGLIAFDAGAKSTKESAVKLETFEFKGKLYEVVPAVE